MHIDAVYDWLMGFLSVTTLSLGSFHDNRIYDSRITPYPIPNVPNYFFHSPVTIVIEKMADADLLRHSEVEEGTIAVSQASFHPCIPPAVPSRSDFTQV
jgi:hypothetical protein